MSVVIDIIFVALVVLSGFIGFKKGLVGILMSVVSLVIAIIAALILQTPLTNYLKQSAVGTTLEEKISNIVQDEVDNKTEEVENSQEKSFVENFVDVDKIQEDMSTSVAQNITNIILKAVSFVGIFILVFIICYMLTMILNIFFDLPILNVVNDIGGVVANILKTIFKFWVAFSIIYFVSFIPFVSKLQDSIEETKITKIVYDNNVIVNVLKGEFKI